MEPPDDTVPRTHATAPYRPGQRRPGHSSAWSAGPALLHVTVPYGRPLRARPACDPPARSTTGSPPSPTMPPDRPARSATNAPPSRTTTPDRPTRSATTDPPAPTTTPDRPAHSAITDRPSRTTIPDQPARQRNRRLAVTHHDPARMQRNLRSTIARLGPDRLLNSGPATRPHVPQPVTSVSIAISTPSGLTIPGPSPPCTRPSSALRRRAAIPPLTRKRTLR